MCNKTSKKGLLVIPETPRVPVKGSKKGSFKGSYKGSIEFIGFKGLQDPLIAEYTLNHIRDPYYNLRYIP